ncbi:tetratricopeptide repeat-containing sulfotransferase family protein [Sphingomonas abietis]|uniref:Sulfotransferase n=1 Tax=Sphingomonas abietis TaxID=3012344 RepID=A0ABY7NP79_9SPHN|nr:tetratricopeptide repeat-containing sulfotransferase family protein [Sphingomonas abietis]WBO22387.1 sulfotransferase [Sphingomonas abietis]
MLDEIAEIERALDREDLPSAAALASRALAKGIRQPLVFNLVAWRHEEDGRLEEAEAVIRDALATWPTDPSLHLALGVVLRKAGGLRSAVESFQRAIELDASYAAAWFERGSTFERGGALADAADDFRRAIELEPGNAAAHASLGASLARRGDRESATHHATQALRLDPGNVTAHNALALVAIEEKRFVDAIALLEPVTIGSLDDREILVSTRTLLGDAYEGAGRYDDAYLTYAAAQTLFHTENSARLGKNHHDALDAAQKTGDSLEAADPALWRGTPTSTGPAAIHVFLTGYPRSGTTLAENILATLPGAVAIEERRTLGMVDRAYQEDTDGLSRFASLPEEQLAVFREAYWTHATEAARESLTGKLFVDMDPFKGGRLPIIAKLFPDAKTVIMRRDPRDVVWSCFHTSFAFNAGTMAFATLESTAKHYALTQRVIERSLATLPINAFELRYELLVRDFDATTQALCSFLGVPWEEELRRFDRTANRRGVSTASTTQVRKGLYDGSGGWRRYERQLATVEPILKPWIERLGYA